MDMVLFVPDLNGGSTDRSARVPHAQVQQLCGQPLCVFGGRGGDEVEDLLLPVAGKLAHHELGQAQRAFALGCVELSGLLLPRPAALRAQQLSGNGQVIGSPQAGNGLTPRSGTR